MKHYVVSVVVHVQADDEDDAIEQGLELMVQGQFTPEVTEVQHA